MAKAAKKPTRVAPRRSRKTQVATIIPKKTAAPPLDRRALHAYASWLFMERRILCSELWPHVGGQAERFDYADNAGYHWHFRGKGSWKDLPQPSTRAAAVLDQVGVDWRTWDEQQYDCGLDHSDDGYRPAFPPGWPRVDGELIYASNSLTTCALALKGLGERKDDDSAEYHKIHDEFCRCLDVLKGVKARSSEGIWAKAAAVRNLDDPDAIAAIAKSLASDILERPEVMGVPVPAKVAA